MKLKLLNMLYDAILVFIAAMIAIAIFESFK